MRDFKRLQEDPPVGVSGAPSENNIMQWNAVIFGPEGTPFEDDSTLQLTFKNVPFLRCNIKEYLQLSEKAMKIVFSFFICIFV